MADYGKNVGIVPLTDAAGITQGFKKGSHYGIDIGWSSVAKDPNCKVLAWQDGKVVDCGFGKEVGNFIVVQHDYEDGHRWTAYIHLKDKPTVKKGSKVTFGKQMGNARRGTSGQSSGVHLHFYLTKVVSKVTKYTWGQMKAACINPVPYCYYDKKYNTEYISKDWTKPLPVKEYYIVKEGDTLQTIATAHNITLAKLCDLNPDLITVGQKLRVK